MSEIDLLIEELEDIENNPIKPFVAIRIGGYLRNYKYHEYRIAELEAERRWIPVSERLPEVGEEVFVCDESGHRRVDWLVCKPIDGVGETLFYSAAYDYDTPTHWMPLPELPNDTQTETFVCG